jgi:putative ABC transport system permease protein
MRLLRSLFRRVRGLVRAEAIHREIDEEARFHIEMRIDENICRGMSPEDARRDAERRFGNLTRMKERGYEVRGGRWLETLWQDLRYSLRVLLKTPVFTCVAVLTLALGIGANTAIFSVVNAVLLRPLPYRDPDRLVQVSHHRVTGIDSVYGPDFLEWREQAKSLEEVVAYSFAFPDLTGVGETERLYAGTISTGLFEMLGVAPAFGRTFTPEEDKHDGPRVVILSDELWRRRFGGDPQVIGRSITLGGQSRTVVGIMPGGFRFPGESDLWLPLALNVAEQLSRQRVGDLSGVLARLKPGVTTEAARVDLSVIIERQRKAFPDYYRGVEVRVIGLSERLVGDVRLPLLVLFGSVTFVLLIACANVANLLLARSVSRQREMAIRAAIGAGRPRLVRQLLTESFLLSLLGGAAGLLAANWCIKLLVAASPDGIARIEETSVDARVLGFTCAVVLLTSLIAGIFPALQASKPDVSETLKAGAGSWRGQASRALPALVITELALAFVLLVGAGLLVKSFLRLMAVPKGFNPDGALTLPLSPSIAKYSIAQYPLRSPQREAYFEESLERVRNLPGIQSASLASGLPFSGQSIRMSILQIEGRPLYEQGKAPLIYINAISSEYFQTMGMRMREGRSFSSQDGANARQVAIVNETFARQFFPNESTIEQRLVIGRVPRTIVGIVGDIRNRGIANSVNPEIYLPNLQYPTGFINGFLVARATHDQNNPTGLKALAAAIRNQVRALDPNEYVGRVVSMDEQLSNSVAGRRFQMLLLSIFAAVALVIAAVGIYGVISYAVSQRTQEIGIRMALGAQTRDVLRLVIWRGMSLALIGVALGLAGALALMRVMKNLLFEVSSTDPATFALIALLLVGVAFIASYIPARRATKVDPLQALRQE